MTGNLKELIFFTMTQEPPVGQGLLIIEDSRSHSDTPHSVGFLWTSDQPDSETSTWQHTTLTRHRCPLPSKIRTHNASKRAATWIGRQLIFLFGATARSWPWPPHSQGFQITHNAPHSVWLLWTIDQPVAETSTWQHTTLTTDRHPCPRWDSNPQSQQASGRKPTP